MNQGFLFGNLNQHQTINRFNASWDGVWQAVIMNNLGNGTYDCVLLRSNTLMSNVQVMDYTAKHALGFPDFNVGQNVLIAFRDNRRDWPIILGSVF